MRSKVGRSLGILPLALSMLYVSGSVEARHRVPHNTPSPARSFDAGRHYVDFVARPNGLVGHSFVQAGVIDRHGVSHAKRTAGFYPADPSKIFDSPGKVTALPADFSAGDAARYRVVVSERSYRKTLALMGQLTRKWQRYDVVQHNCNCLVADVARHLGLAVPGDKGDLPINYVHTLEQANGGRTRASFRP